MKKHDVIAEMVDVHTDKRYFPGDTFTPHDDDQRARLRKAGCLAEPDGTQAPTTAPAPVQRAPRKPAK